MHQAPPYFGNEDVPGRDTLLFKCREAIESLQEEIEDYQKALNERDFLLSQAQEREEQLINSKNIVTQDLENMRGRFESIKEELKETKSKLSGK